MRSHGFRWGIAAVTGAALLMACATTTTAPLSRETTEAEVDRCDFLGTVSGIGMPWGDYNHGRNKAIAKMATEADSRGATHYVITRVSDTGQGIEAVGRAYRCTDRDT